MNEICNKLSHRDRWQACKVDEVLWFLIKASSQTPGAEEKLPSQHNGKSQPEHSHSVS